MRETAQIEKKNMRDFLWRKNSFITSYLPWSQAIVVFSTLTALENEIVSHPFIQYDPTIEYRFPIQE